VQFIFIQFPATLFLFLLLSSFFASLTLILFAKRQDGPVSHVLSVPTIAYMPHCDMVLYESFLRENWSKDRISFMTLIANTLADYIER
jgi:hypothetical protein